MILVLRRRLFLTRRRNVGGPVARMESVARLRLLPIHQGQASLLVSSQGDVAGLPLGLCPSTA